MHGAGGESEHAADTTRVRGARKGGLAYPLRTRTGDTPWLMWEAACRRLPASCTSATPVARERAPTTIPPPRLCAARPAAGCLRVDTRDHRSCAQHSIHDDPVWAPSRLTGSLRAPHDVAYTAVRALESSCEQRPHRHPRERFDVHDRVPGRNTAVVQHPLPAIAASRPPTDNQQRHDRHKQHCERSLDHER